MEAGSEMERKTEIESLPHADRWKERQVDTETKAEDQNGLR